MKKLANNKRSSLFCRRIGDEDKNVFLRLAPGVNVIKLFSFITVNEAK
jgi:hypothetical protein